MSLSSPEKQLNNVSVKAEETCCGCSACQALCPIGAISMAPNEQGFLYPRVDDSLCSHCGLCLRVCEKATTKAFDTLSVFAAQNKDVEVLRRSSSGGLSNALCRLTIQDGGVVYGVCCNKNFEVVYKRADSLKDCDGFYGSKYVQANLLNTFHEVYHDLQEGKQVLFTGTSCHIAGLSAYLEMKKCNVDRLTTVDLICHGVPPQRLFSDYIRYLSKTKPVSDFVFRTKKRAWGVSGSDSAPEIIYQDGASEVRSMRSRLYLNMFLSRVCLRSCCFQCQFANIKKPADLTIGDYWGIRKEHPNFDSPNGVSVVLVHSAKGAELLNKSNVDLLKSSVERILRRQSSLRKPGRKPREYDKFWKTYQEQGFDALTKQYGRKYLLKKAFRRSFVFKLLRRTIKLLLRRK